MLISAHESRELRKPMRPIRKLTPHACVRGLLSVVALLSLAGCSSGDSAAPRQRVVLYTSVDQQFAEPLLERFEQETGIAVDALFDTEAGKTTGLVRRLQREASSPRCDVWWSGEVFGTIELAAEGLLEAYESEAAADIPSAWRDAQSRWVGFGARARVIAFDRARPRAAAAPSTWEQVADAPDVARLALANPQFGTTRGHCAALYHAWGAERFERFLRRLAAEQVQLADGNAHAVRLVAAGQADWCWTDTDDVWVMQRRTASIDLVYPRLDADGPVLWIPNSLALVRGGPNGATARRLYDFLASAAVERALAGSDSRNVPVRAALRAELATPQPHPEPIAYADAAQALPAAMKLARDILLR